MTVAMLQGASQLQQTRNIGSQTRFQSRDHTLLSTILQKCAMDVDVVFFGGGGGEGEGAMYVAKPTGRIR